LIFFNVWYLYLPNFSEPLSSLRSITAYLYATSDKKTNKNMRQFIFAAFLLTFTFTAVAQNCLYKNPLCFYNTDVLNYLKILHQNQQYEKMAPFFYGPYVNSLKRSSFIEQLSNQDFGYTMKRAGVKEESKEHWSLTYQRTIMGTNSNFKIKCALVNDTCRVYLDEKAWKEIFQ